MVNIDELRFDEKGLIPAVVVDTYSKRVLTVAWYEQKSPCHQHEGGQNLLLVALSSGALAQGRNERQCAAYRLHYGRLRRGR